MSIEMSAQCFVCHLGHQVDAARQLGSEAQAMAFARDLMRIYQEAPEGMHSSWLTPRTSALFKKHYGLTEDRFAREKRESNEFVLARLEEIREKVNLAADPLLAALQFSILGNYLDFSALQGEVSFDKLDEMLDRALDMELDLECYAQLKDEFAKGKRLLYLTDNAGEIGFDRIFAETIRAQYPQLDITVCVRGETVQNDATREDAALVGMPFPVIDNGKGNYVGGTVLELLGPEAREAMDSADVIIAKGMGNTETLYGCGYPIF